MGLIKGWIEEMGDMWGRMSAGDPTAFLGLPSQHTGTGSGTGPGGPPGSLTDHQRQMLMRFFHQQYGRYPQSEYEFQQWLRDNW
jgi:hypothetical protein